MSSDDWSDAIIEIAKEEMGHLLCVQNVLRALGGPLSFDREHFPARSQIYPFPFMFEPFTKDSLAKYVAVEMPFDVDPLVLSQAEADKIWERAKKGAGGANVNHVGALYERLQIEIAKLDPSEFRAETAAFEAHAGGDSHVTNQRTADDRGVKVFAVEASGATNARDVAVNALKVVARQGEGLMASPAAGAVDNSHFRRFLTIYEAFPEGFRACLDVPTNTNTTEAPAEPPGDMEGMLFEKNMAPDGSPTRRPFSRRTCSTSATACCSPSLLTP